MLILLAATRCPANTAPAAARPNLCGQRDDEPLFRRGIDGVTGRAGEGATFGAANGRVRVLGVPNGVPSVCKLGTVNGDGRNGL